MVEEERGRKGGSAEEEREGREGEPWWPVCGGSEVEREVVEWRVRGRMKNPKASVRIYTQESDTELNGPNDPVTGLAYFLEAVVLTRPPP